jgi:endonuclease-3
LEQEIRSTGFYRNKAKNIKGCCRILVEKHGSQVPKTMNELLELPGVARKTANIVLSNAYNIIEGIAVDSAVAGRKLTAEKVAEAIKSSELENKVKHRNNHKR